MTENEDLEPVEYASLKFRRDIWAIDRKLVWSRDSSDMTKRMNENGEEKKTTSSGALKH